MGSQWLYKPHGVKQTKEFFHFLFHSIKFHFLSPCNLLTCVLMALITQGQKFNCGLSLCVFAPGRETVGSCFLLSPPSPTITPQMPASPLLSSPCSTPPFVKKVRRDGSELSPSLLFFLQLPTKNTVLFSCSGGEKARENYPAGTLQSVLTAYSHSCQSLSFCFASRSCLYFRD